MKARKVKGIDPDGPAAAEVAKIVAVRLEELCSFMPKARDPAAVHTLHDMRIAAKRLRYVLELFAGAFGPHAADAAKQAKKLQDVLGEIHDCDVTRPRVAALAAELRAEDARAVRALAPADAKDLDPALAAQAPHRAAYRGLHTMDVALAARRELLFERFLDRWDKLERQGFRDRLTEAITSRSHDGNGDGAADGLPSEVAT
ncbi:MAG: metallophosphoesterase [Conexibacter sp.]|nr:metallophosphoesterase [Conexibacter sp.]